MKPRFVVGWWLVPSLVFSLASWGYLFYVIWKVMR